MSKYRFGHIRKKSSWIGKTNLVQFPRLPLTQAGRSSLADQGRMIKMWFEKSANDLKAANLLAKQNSEDFLGSSVFHAQQAAEKAMKGFLTFHKIRFTKTHNIALLVSLISEVDPQLATELKPAIILTEFAVAYRYPEEKEPPEPLTEKSCEKVNILANWVCAELRSRILV